MVTPSEEIKEFLANMESAGPEEYRRLPGLGLYKVRQIKKALNTGAIAMHWSGKGFGWSIEEEAGINGRRLIALNQSAKRFNAEVDAEDRRGRLMTSADTRNLLVTYHRLLDRAPEPAATRPDLSFDL